MSPTAGCAIKLFCVILFFVLCCCGPWGFVGAVFWWLILAGLWRLPDDTDV